MISILGYENEIRTNGFGSQAIASVDTFFLQPFKTHRARLVTPAGKAAWRQKRPLASLQKADIRRAKPAARSDRGSVWTVSFWIGDAIASATTGDAARRYNLLCGLEKAGILQGLLHPDLVQPACPEAKECPKVLYTNPDKPQSLVLGAGHEACEAKHSGGIPPLTTVLVEVDDATVREAVPDRPQQIARRRIAGCGCGRIVH